MTDLRTPLPEPAYSDAARPSILVANALYLLAGAGVVLQAVFVKQIRELLRLLFGVFSSVQALLGIDALLYPLFFLLPVVILATKHGGRAMRFNGIGVRMTVLCLLTGIVCVFLSGTVSTLWLLLLNALRVPISSAQIYIANESELILGVVVIAVIPGIFEELLFRGPILAAYEKGGTRRAVLVSSVLFAMLHGSIEGFPTQFIMGLVLAFAVVSTGSIYAGMMIHTSFNAAQLLISYMLSSAVSQTADSAATAIDGLAGSIAVTGVALVMGFIAFGVVMLLMRSFKRYRTRNGIALFPHASLGFGVAEAIVLISGVVTALFLYAENLFGILEYLL